MGSRYAGINEKFEQAVRLFTCRFNGWNDQAVDYEDLPNSLEFYRTSALNKMRDELLQSYLRITVLDFDGQQVLWCMRRHCRDFIERNNKGFGQWWESEFGWSQCRELNCSSDVSCALGALGSTKPSEWTQEDVMIAIAIDQAFNDVAFPFKDGTHLSHVELNDIPATAHGANDEQMERSGSVGDNRSVSATRIYPSEHMASFPEKFDGPKRFIEWLVKVTTAIKELKFVCSVDSLHTVLKNRRGKIKFKACKTHAHMYHLVDALKERFPEVGLGYEVSIGDQVKSATQINDVLRKHKIEECPNNVRAIINHARNVPIGRL